MNQKIKEPCERGSISAVTHCDPLKNTNTHFFQFLCCVYFTVVSCLLTITGSTQTLFGTTTYGGANNRGAIIKLQATTNTLTPAYSFDQEMGASPIYVQLVQASNGKLFGMTRSGGSNGYGVIFSFDPATNTYTKLKEFDGTNGGNPYGSLMQATNGKLYGMTPTGGSSNVGVIFSYDPATNTYIKLKEFDGTNGGNPYGSLMQATDGKLYGMTQYGGSSGDGVIFSFDPATNTYTKLQNFNYDNGSGPYGSLMQAANGKLYGMTYSGGSSYGVIFSFNPATNTISKLKEFDGANGGLPYGSLIQAANGKLYGMTSISEIGSYGVIFSFDPATSTYAKLKDFDGTNGRSPYGSLMQATDGKLYGMTHGGGGSNYGVIFSFDPATSTYAKLKDFDWTNGRYPYGSLMQATDGKLYGVTAQGGGSDIGVIFSLDPATNTYTKLKDFDGINGKYPYGSLMQATDGKLYGMTNSGGSSNGVIYSFDPVSSIYTKLKDFDGTNGSKPWGSLMQAMNGKLYGMTYEGGSSGYGVIFSFDPATNSYTKLEDFDRTSGAYPEGHLIQPANGKLYGMTAIGGSSNYGVIFSYDPGTNAYTKLKDFDRTTGAYPHGSLMQATDGKLYGMTQDGGSSDVGVIFSFDPASTTYTKLRDFDGTNGAYPYGSLMQATNGKLYGMTNSGGSSNYGVIFSFDPATNTYTKLTDFDGTNGRSPRGSLMQATDGKLYGMTNLGGSSDIGVIFSFDPATTTYTKLKDFDGTNGANPAFDASLIELKASCQNATTLTTSNITSTGAQLNWVAPVNPVQWQVQYKVNVTDSAWRKFVLHGSARTLTLTGLLPNTSYKWHIRAKCGTSWTAYSTAVTFKTTASCQNATTLTTSNITSSSVKLNWVAPVDPVKWQVQYKVNVTDSAWRNVVLNGSARTLALTGLQPNTSYKWHIRAKCGTQWSSYSVVANFKTSVVNQGIIAETAPEEKMSNSKLYPNPSNGQFTVDLYVPSKVFTKAQISLIDIYGNIVQTESAEPNEGLLHKTITISSALTNGMYIVRVIVNDKIFRGQLVYMR